MIAEIPVNDMAETLRVLAGANAGNAAHHFRKWSYDSGDAASAILWSSIARMLEHIAEMSDGKRELSDPPPVQILQLREGMAFENVWFEDIDAEVLAREEPSETLDLPLPEETGGAAEMERGFGYAGDGGSPASNAGVEGPQALEPAIAA